MNIKKYFDGDIKETWAVVWRFLLVLLAMAALVGMLVLTTKY